MRVIAGTAKGRLLIVPKGVELRPTTDKVKEAIFSMLTAEGMKRMDEEDGPDTDFPYPRVLDLYAGTGSLGIEALSRGAELVDFVESNRKARAAIEENLRRTGFTSQATVHALRAQGAVSTFKNPYDLILLDPPYDDASVPGVLEALGRAAILVPGGTVVLEHARSRDAGSRAGRLQHVRSRYYGTTAVSLYRLDESQ